MRKKDTWKETRSTKRIIKENIGMIKKGKNIDEEEMREEGWEENKERAR